MRAVQLIAAGTLEARDVDSPDAGPGEAVIAIEASGVCRTDWHLWRGDWEWEGISLPFPRTLGHEIAGTVTAVGPDVRKVRVGERVTVPFHLSCGRCEHCLAGETHVCAQADYLGSSLDGGYAQSVRIPRADLNVIPIPDWLSSDAAAAMGCRYMTAFHAITLQGRVGAGDWVAVYGAAGGVGLSAIQILAAMGALPLAIDIGPEKLEAARSLGAVETIDATDGDVAERVLDVTAGGAHVALDALGSSRTIVPSIRSLRAKGRHVQIGLTSSDDAGTVDMPVDLMVLKELEFLGSAGNPLHRYAPLFRFLRASGADPSRLISRRIGLDDIDDVLRGMDGFRGSGLAVITDFDSGRTMQR